MIDYNDSDTKKVVDRLIHLSRYININGNKLKNKLKIQNKKFRKILNYLKSRNAIRLSPILKKGKIINFRINTRLDVLQGIMQEKRTILRQIFRWEKVQKIIVILSFILLVLSFLGYNPFKDISPPILINFNNESRIFCEHYVPETNSTTWKIMKEYLPEGLNISEFNQSKIDSVLYYPWGFILTINREQNIDIIEPKLVINYDIPNFFHSAYLVEFAYDDYEHPNNTIKIYTGVSPPLRYKKIRDLFYHLDSPLQTTVTLPDLNDDTKKIVVALNFLIDLNHDCNKNIPVHFKIIEEMHGLETKDYVGIIKLRDKY